MGVKAILTLGVAIVALAGFAGLLVREVGVLAAISAVGAGVCLVVAGVAVMLIEWGGGRGKTD